LGGGIFYGSTFNIFKPPLGQQQNLHNPPRETSKLFKSTNNFNNAALKNCFGRNMHLVKKYNYSSCALGLTVLPELVLEAVLGIVMSVSSLSLLVDSLTRSLSVE